MMKRITRKGFLRALPLGVIDVAATFVAYFLAAWGTQVAFVLGGPNVFGYLAFFAFVNVVVYAVCKMYSCLWEYASVDEAMRLVVASVVASVVGDVLGYFMLGARLPLRVYIVAWLLFLAISAAARFAIRLWSGSKSWSLFGTTSKGLPRSLVIGAGETGSLTVKRMLAFDADMAGCPVGLVDDVTRQGGRLRARHQGHGDVRADSRARPGTAGRAAGHGDAFVDQG